MRPRMKSRECRRSVDDALLLGRGPEGLGPGVGGEKQAGNGFLNLSMIFLLAWERKNKLEMDF